MPSTAVDPLSWLGLLHRLFHLADNLVPALRLHQVEVQLCETDAVDMPMSFDEPGNNERAGEIDDLSLLSDVALHLRAAAKRGDAVSADGHGLDLRGVFFERDDLAVKEHQVGWQRRRVAARVQQRGRAAERTTQ